MRRRKLLSALHIGCCEQPYCDSPLVGQCEAASVRHRRFENGPMGPSVYTFESDLNPLDPGDDVDADTDTRVSPSSLVDGPPPKIVKRPLNYCNMPKTTLP